MEKRKQKIAVVLFNLGGPDRPESIYPFLVRFFMDPAIIRAPFLVRFFLSRLIALKRTFFQAGSAYARLGGKSPLLENTQKQARALETALNLTNSATKTTYSVHICMRYWHPTSDQVVTTLLQDDPDHIILLPLYPQFSTTTTGSSRTDFEKSAHQAGLTCPVTTICCYPEEAGFIRASVDRIMTAWNRMQNENPGCPRPRFLFSAHGLPEKIIRSGDPYQDQCEKTARALAAALPFDNPDWQICYQSRVGPMKWIGPSTKQALEQAARDGVPVLVYPHAFVSEHVETRVEIDEEYRAFALKTGVPAFARAETVMDHPAFIQGLAELVFDATDRIGVVSGRNFSHCGDRFFKCALKKGLLDHE